MTSARTSTDDLLRLAAERGVTHLTIWPVPSADGKTTYWKARGQPSTNHKYVECSDTDPVIALRGVLIGMPKAPKRAAPSGVKPTKDEPEITATVTEAPPPAAPHQETIDTWLPRT